MPSGVVPQYRLCLVLTNGVQMEEGWLQVRCYSYRGAITSDMSSDPVSLSDMHVSVVQLQACMLGSFIQICVCL